MKNKLSTRTFLSMGLLMSSLMLLPGCFDWAKKSTSCPGCPAEVGEGHADQKLEGEALVTMQGKPFITKESFQKYYDELLADEPQAKMMEQLMPDLCKQIFDNRLMQLKVRQWAKETKKDQDPTFKRRMERQREMLETQECFELLKADVLAGMDTSDEVIKKYYEENRAQNAVFQQPPFIATPEGIQVQSVSFNTEKSAQEFAQKAKKAGADFASLAKAAKKEVKNLGVVSAQSRGVESAIRFKARDMNPGDIEVVNVNGKQFDVIKAGAKQQAKYLPFEDEKVKETLKDLIPKIRLNEALTARLKEITDQYGFDESKATEYFKQETEKRRADLQEQIKRAQEQQQEADQAQGGQEQEQQQSAQPASAASASTNVNKPATA